jgi:hypothetical protein
MDFVAATVSWFVVEDRLTPPCKRTEGAEKTYAEKNARKNPMFLTDFIVIPSLYIIPLVPISGLSTLFA